MALEVSRTVEKLAEQMLGEAYELVLSGWCQGDAAQDELGRSIEPSSAFARSWSAVGALERAWRRMPGEDDSALEAFERANLALAGVVRGVPGRWNDDIERSREDVLAALHHARALVRSPGGPEPSLIEDLLDGFDHHETIAGYLFEGFS